MVGGSIFRYSTVNIPTSCILQNAGTVEKVNHKNGSTGLKTHALTHKNKIEIYQSAVAKWEK